MCHGDGHGAWRVACGVWRGGVVGVVVGGIPSSRQKRSASRHMRSVAREAHEDKWRY